MTHDAFIAELEARYGPAPTWRRFRRPRQLALPTRPPSRRVRAIIERWAREAPTVPDLPF